MGEGVDLGLQCPVLTAPKEELEPLEISIFFLNRADRAVIMSNHLISQG